MSTAAPAAPPAPAPSTSICLTSSLLCSLFPQEMEASGFIRAIDLTKELTSSDFPMVSFVLKNARTYSTTPASPLEIPTTSSSNGLLYLYDSTCVGDHLNDGISWKSSKLAIKLVIWSQNSRRFKIKNAKGETGTPVLRRQMWQSQDPTPGWRRYEYRVFTTVQCARRQQDGSVRTYEQQSLQQFPCLVHYFRKDPSAVVSRSLKRSAPTPVVPVAPVAPVAPATTTTTTTTTDDPGSLSGSEASEASFELSVPETQWLVPSSASVGTTVSVAAAAVGSGSPCVFDGVADCCGPALLSPGMVDDFDTTRSLDLKCAIRTYAPDLGPVGERTKILAVVEEFAGVGDLSCHFGNSEVPAFEVFPGCFEFETPLDLSPGVCFFWLSRISGMGDGAPSRLTPRITAPSMFFCTPVDGQLCLANSQLGANEGAPRILSKFRHVVRELDLSHNGLNDVMFLDGFFQLRTLILDGNGLNSCSQFPRLSRLELLTVNNNAVDNLEKFVDSVVAAFPSLQCFSMLGNAACPYFLGQPHHYYNYRIYCISRMPHLVQLDSGPVTAEERKHASCIRT